MREMLSSHLQQSKVRRRRAFMMQWMAVTLHEAVSLVCTVLAARHRRRCCRLAFGCWQEASASPLLQSLPVYEDTDAKASLDGWTAWAPTHLNAEHLLFDSWRQLCQQRYSRWEAVQCCRLRSYVKIVRKVVTKWQMQARLCREEEEEIHSISLKGGSRSLSRCLIDH